MGTMGNNFIITVTKFKMHLHVAKLSSGLFIPEQNLLRATVSELSRVTHSHQFILITVHSFFIRGFQFEVFHSTTLLIHI